MERSDDELLRATLAAVAPGTDAARRPRADPARPHRRADRARLRQDGRGALPPAASRSTSSSPPPGCASWPRWTARSSSTATSPGSCAPPPSWCPTPRSRPPSPAPGTAPPSGWPSRPASRSSRSASRCGSSRSTSAAAGTCSRTRPRSCPGPTRPWPPSSATSSRLDEVTGTLSALEIEDLVTVRDVAAVLQRLEMVRRISEEIDGYVVELGTDGRLLTLQLDELTGGVGNDRELVIRDYLERGAQRAQRSRRCSADLSELSVDRAARPRRRRQAARLHRRRRRARRRGQPARLPAAVQGARACPAPSSTGWSTTSAACRSCSPPASTT